MRSPVRRSRRPLAFSALPSIIACARQEFLRRARRARLGRAAGRMVAPDAGGQPSAYRRSHGGRLLLRSLWLLVEVVSGAGAHRST
jgi:hypothetical protein